MPSNPKTQVVNNATELRFFPDFGFAIEVPVGATPDELNRLAREESKKRAPVTETETKSNE